MDQSPIELGLVPVYFFPPIVIFNCVGCQQTLKLGSKENPVSSDYSVTCQCGKMYQFTMTLKEITTHGSE